MSERIMMTDITGKMATEGGRLLGYINDVVMDTDNGLLRYLILETPAQESEMADENGRAVIPVSRIRIEQGYVIVNR